MAGTTYSSMIKQTKYKLVFCFLCAIFLVFYAWKDMSGLMDCCENSPLLISDVFIDGSKETAQINSEYVEKDYPGIKVIDSPEKLKRFAEVKLTRSEEVEDIDIDGNINLDLQGGLIYDQELRDLLDFFIGLSSTSHELPILKSALMQYLIDRDYSKKIIADVMDDMSRYLDYRKAVVNLDMMSVDNVGIASLFDELYRLRRFHLGREMADGFFFEEEASNKYIVERQKILMTNMSTSPDEKNIKLQMLQQELPVSIVNARDKAIKITDVRREVIDLKEKGASEFDVYQIRQNRLGGEAAQRLAELDEKRRQWNKKLKNYKQEKNKLFSNTQLQESDLLIAIHDLQSQYFSETEIIRVNALLE
ncbi:MAG: hypothetical protein K6L75_10025 [Cellvibrionaceae bacterium]